MSKKKSRATRLAESQRAAERAAAIRAEQERSERRRRTLVVGGLVVVVLAFILVIGYAVQASRDTTGASAAAPQGAAGFGLPVGKKTAPVSVTIYEARSARSAASSRQPAAAGCSSTSTPARCGSATT
jgi:hypothetical protein